jgi:hypothetical protein
MSSLIVDIAETREFVERILNKLEDDEVYILFLSARKKYCPTGLSSSEEILARLFIRDNDTNIVLKKIFKVSLIDGAYVDRNTLEEISGKCCAIYILMDPRSTLRGYGEFVHDINRWIYESFIGESKNLDLYRRIDIKLFSAVHKNRSRRLYVSIDIDKKDEMILDKITDLLKGHIEWISETHGGFHVIVPKNDETGTIIHKNIIGMEYVELQKEPTTPMPGTLQGGFAVRGIRRELWK